MTADADRKTGMPRRLRVVKPRVVRTAAAQRMIYVILSALLSLSARRLRHAISACQPLCNRCLKRATAASSLPGDRMCPQESVEDRYCPPVRLSAKLNVT